MSFFRKDLRWRKPACGGVWAFPLRVGGEIPEDRLWRACRDGEGGVAKK